MNKKEALAFLRNNPVFWSRLGFCYDPPLMDETGAPLVFDKDFSRYLRTHDAFSDAGVKTHTCILHAGWVGVDQYDYSLCDQVLESVFASGKAEYFIPRIKLNVPIDWCRENPTEVCVYVNGPRDKEQIRAMVGTPQHDYLGYESPKGYYNANGWQDTRPNVGGLIARQSFSSRKWLEDAGEALRRLIEHLENSKWGDRILAYHVCYGTSGETAFWGRIGGKFGDYGITNQACFLQWGIRKYGSEEAARKAWGISATDEVIPLPELREKPHDASDDFYKDDTVDCWSIDYDLFNSEINTDALMYFGDVVKKYAPEKPVGTFYGYILHPVRAAYTGHLGWKRILENDGMDFFAAPKSYFRCEPGEPGGEMAPTVSINRTHLWLDECDNRTHLAVNDFLKGAACPEETYTVILREMCKNASHNSGLWYMDLGGGWYDDEGIMANVADVVKASNEIRKRPYQSVAQLTVIADESSILKTHPEVTWHTQNLLRNFQLTGTPIDVIMTHDIGKIDLSGTKLAVFLTPFDVKPETVAALRQALPQDGHILFCGKSKAEASVALQDVAGQAAPTYTILPSEGCTPVCTQDGNVIAAQNPEGDFVLSALDASVSNLRKIVQSAGVHCYAPEQCAVYADSRFVSFFPRQSMTFVPDVPGCERMTELYTGEEYPAGTELTIAEKRGMAFLIG